MTNQEVIDRVADAIRNTRMVVSPDDSVTIYAEDEQTETPGKKYIFYLVMPLAQLKALLEWSPPPPLSMD